MIMQEQYLKNKRILFVGQIFYDYHTKILDELKNQGAEVDFYENKFFPEYEKSSWLARSVRKFFLPNRKKKYNDEIINSIGLKEYDYFFCIGGFSITPELLRHVKTVNKKIISIIYFWDSFSVWDHSKLFLLFDRAYSFDPLDCDKWEALKYLPLFYTNEYTAVDNSAANKEDIDLLYIGSVGLASMNRCDILLDLDHYSRRMELRSFLRLYFQANDATRGRKVLNAIKRLLFPGYRTLIAKINKCKNEADFITTSVLGREEVAELTNRAKCVVDIPVPGQVGLTIRTIETLARGKKVITSNVNIKKESIYNKEYVYVLEGSDFEVDREFISSVPTHKLDIEDFHITNWLRRIFTDVN
ncbi:hypothetical protein PV783_01400 [Chitinophaga sp. CC14]|uniref:hypothetical protein n=1 Tax=Chitinophaga sp. CC14 TaxID=3029199 RepID=UPI003B7EB2D9